LKSDSLLHDAAGSKISPLESVTAVGSQILLLHLVAGSQILPLHGARGRQIVPPHDAAGSQFGSGGVKSQNFGGLTGPLKGQSCKKSHMGDYYLLFSTQLPKHQRMSANGNGYQMIYFPETVIQ
jgi:hypothetical protein